LLSGHRRETLPASFALCSWPFLAASVS
jgi:hypothetical protein